MRDHTLLLVEDDELLGSYVSDLLGEKGYSVDWMKTGNRGRDAIKNNQYSLILLDSELPGIPGIELLKQVRQKNEVIPVIVATGRASMEDEKNFLEVGANAYFAKPFDVDDLMSKITSLLAV